MPNSIHLRAAELEDVSFLHQIFNDPNIMDYWFNEPYQTRHQLENNLKEKRKDSRLFIITNDMEEQIGLIGFYFIDQRHRHAEFAIAVDPAHQGKGYATRAMELALDYAFYTLNFRKVYLIVVDINEKASHIYEKVGFKVEGRLVEHYFIKGKYNDGIMMGIFNKYYIE